MYAFEANNPVIVTQLKWAGSWGPFKIKSRCQECDLVTGILRDMMEQHFKGRNVVFEVKPWLNNVIFALRRGAWHPPIIMINGRLFFQFSHKRPLFDRGDLMAAIETILREQDSLKKESGEADR